MLRLIVTSLLVAGLAASAAATESEPAPSPAASGSCGVKLVLKNPDLQERPTSGKLEVSGLFFIQFQAVGANAEKVKSLSFSFGKPIPDAAMTCTTPEWITGAYIKDYRSDRTPEDGFFVPINTTLVPDGEYAGAVHAYDASKAEIGRFFVKADVKNGCGMPRCQDKTAADLVKTDKIVPWPRVLPGDGVQSNTDVQGLSIEFAEPVAEVQAFINGNETVLEKWPGIPLDDDVIPGNDQDACTVPAPVCVKRLWGPAYKWVGEIAQNDVVRVVAKDVSGNRVEKILHLLDPTQGAIVTGDKINVDISADETTKTTTPGHRIEYQLNLLSLGGQEAHVNLALSEYPTDKLELTLRPNHVVLKSGERATAALVTDVKPTTATGTFQFTVTATWRSEGQDVSKGLPLTLVVGDGTNAPPPPTGNATGNETGGAKGADGGTPAPLLPAASAAIVAAAVVLRRRRS